MVKESALQNDIHVESCGLGDWHEGQLPDERMLDVCKKRGVVLQSRAQLFKSEFFDTFDYILVADHQVMGELNQAVKDPSHKMKIHLFTTFSSAYNNQDIPDPYYRRRGEFEMVMDMIEDSCQGLLDNIRDKFLQ